MQDRKILQRIFDRIDSKKDNKIDKEELEQTLVALGYEPVKVRNRDSKRATLSSSN